jgi:hypothetical protein
LEALLKYPPRASAIIPPTTKKMIVVCSVRGNRFLILIVLFELPGEAIAKH